MITVSITYEIVTPESADHGDIAESGFIQENEKYQFRELIDFMWREGFRYPSDSMGTPSWLSDEGSIDYPSGAMEYCSIHPARDPVSQRYWAKVCRYLWNLERGKR